MLRLRTRRSFRRSRVRHRIVQHLHDFGRTDERALMRALGLTRARLLEALHGGTSGYREEDPPFALGIVRRVRTAAGPAYELTERGRLEARQVEALRDAQVPL